MPSDFRLPRPVFDRLQRSPKRTVRALLFAYTAWHFGEPYVEKGRQFYRSRRTFTLTVPGTDDLYEDLAEWVLTQVPADHRRALIATSGGGRAPYFDGPTEIDLVKAEPDERPRSSVRLRYDGNRTHTIRVKGHPIEVSMGTGVDKETSQLFFMQEHAASWKWRKERERITFVAKTAAGRDALVDKMAELVDIRKGNVEQRPPLFLSNRWGSGWDRRDDLPRRTIDSVILPGDQLDRIVKDVETFLADEQEYNRLTTPWHRGYLFHGPPGTGKTSLAKALAEHFKMPLYYIPLADIEKDGDLVSLVSMIGPRSILLLEDVDVFHAAKDRDDDGPGVTLTGVLNSLDGIWTPHGLITFLTTNDRSVLDEAVVRPGRVDMEEKLGLLDRDQALRMARWYFGPTIPISIDWATWHGHAPAAMLSGHEGR